MRFPARTMISKTLLRGVGFSVTCKSYCSLYIPKVCGFHQLGQRLEARCYATCGTANVADTHVLNHGSIKGPYDEAIARRKKLKEERHCVLMSHLQDCASVEQQIKLLSWETRLSEEDMERRKKSVKALHDILVPFFPNSELTLFGSSVNGLGFKDSDVDVYFNLHCSDHTNESQKQQHILGIKIPTLDEVKSGKISLKDLADHPRIVLRFIRNVFKTHCKDIVGDIKYIGGRHPLLRFRTQEGYTKWDFSFGDNVSLQNTRLVQLVTCLDERILPLLRMLCYWAKRRGLIYGLNSFNSYGFFLLVTSFLQNTNPPVLPPISLLKEESGYLSDTVGDNKLLLNDLKKFPQSKNTQTVDELLREFFFYYLYFDFSHVICPLSGLCMPHMEFKAQAKEFEYTAIAIQNPFVKSANIIHSAKDNYCMYFLQCVLEVCQSYQESEMWIPNLEKPWGIMSFLGDSPVSMKPEKDVVHAIKIPLETASQSKQLQSGLQLAGAKEIFQRATRAVIDVFERGLLFKCKHWTEDNGVLVSGQAGAEVDICHELDVEKCSKSVTKISCTAYDVLSGRTNLRNLSAPSDVTNHFLEKERLVSEHIFQRIPENKAKTHCSFQCECVELQKDVPALLVLLTFPKDNYKRSVAVFLKEYLPSFVQQSL